LSTLTGRLICVLNSDKVGAGFPRPDALITDAAEKTRPYFIGRIYFSDIESLYHSQPEGSS
jgi:hypothetical protein